MLAIEIDKKNKFFLIYVKKNCIMTNSIFKTSKKKRLFKTPIKSIK